MKDLIIECNSLSSLLVDIVQFGPLRIAISLTILNTRLLGRGFPPLWGMLRSPLQLMWDITIRPLWGPASLLAHCLVSGSSTICNWGFPQGFKTCLLWKEFSPTSTSVLHRPVTGFYTICNSPSLPLVNIVCFDPLRIVVSLTVLKHVY